MTQPRHILVAVAWPYANGVQHLGHLAGAYLPPDVFARYHRIAGNRVLMVSGSDAHGTPITVMADDEGVSPAEIVARFHPLIVEQWETFGISFDLFTTTMTPWHRDATWEFFRTLHSQGLLEARATQQMYDPEVERFLPDRYVEGTCPHCAYSDARGDQCDNCGRTLDPTDLIDPRSTRSGATPVPRETTHGFLQLQDLGAEVGTWLSSREGWRPAVINWARGFVREGLHERAVTRDLEWGVPIPPELDTIGEGKRIYVWFDAVIGYLSAAREWAERSGAPDAWRAWWEDPDAESYYFVGKDNIPFHAVFWPAYLLGVNRDPGRTPLNLPSDVPANQFVTFKGEKASKSRGIGTPLMDYLDDGFTPDTLRYATAAILPEQTDTDVSLAELARRVNDELAGAWGNLVNRVAKMAARYLDGIVPDPDGVDERDRGLLEEVDAALAGQAAHLEAVELRAGLRRALGAAQTVNAYLNEREPWRTAKDDPPRTAATLWTALQAIAGVNVGFAPYVPFSAVEVDRMLGGDGELEGRGWARREVPAGTKLGDLPPLFPKVELPEEPDVA